MFTALMSDLSTYRRKKKQEKILTRFVDLDSDRVDDRLEKAIEAAGYSYDEKQDIFYSNMNAWQRSMGYCRLYDEGAALFGMIIDCEPIYFEYEGRRWLIEFWKGQYDLPTGAEIGIYATDGPDIEIPGVFKGPLFYTVSDHEALEMSYTLKKYGKKLFTREGKHWWLTGFKLGLFSNPYELTMDLSINFKDKVMQKAFIQGLKNAGYKDSEIKISGSIVALEFDRPHTPQPATRTLVSDIAIQLKNKFLCDKYNEIAKHYDNFPDQINAIYEQAPELYEKIINIDKPKRLLTKIEKFAKYIN
ncbi:DUF4474 domain-containing protein [Clostridium swellfunianum]|uniref:DUF4474 domain-containing protein n=1 Tax=Clostridium swellfunianum TaxID=1367462 RepID=UPI00202E175C|nr:DUF4474 domain-containing protein [Clostridium swellfunianum]MCM0648972.1 DUF4474 domain-containing protein [Clostridium swellfunianum]